MKYIKYFFLFACMIFSFFISDKALLYVESLNPVMKEINDVQDKYKESSVDAIIEGNTIIPGKKGKEINKRESYLKMKEFKTFNETFIIYDYIKPNISLENNKDKIIISGNDSSKISIIIKNQEHEKYMLEQNIAFDKIISNREEMTNSALEYIDISNRINVKNKICLIDYTNINDCKKEKKFLVKITDFINKNTLYKINNIKGASIVYFDENISINEFKVLLNKIKNKKLNIVTISELIKE